jgi:hypothetical protein
MAYVFDPTNGDTRAELAERVVFNSFSSTRYQQFVLRALNDAVTTICRKLEVFETYEVLAYDGTGKVADPTNPWLRIDEVWQASASSAASGEVAFAMAANYPLQPLPDHVLGRMTVGGSPIFYITRRRRSANSFAPLLDLIISTPGTLGGFVAVKGLERPPVMDADGDTTGLGAEFDRAVMSYAKADCFDNEDDFEAADRWRLRADSALREAIEGDVSNDGPDTVEGTWAD